MEVDFTNIGSPAATGPTNPSSTSTGGIMFDQSNPFGNINSNRSMEWDFGNSSHGNGGGL
jgi:hypothetical protein